MCIMSANIIYHVFYTYFLHHVQQFAQNNNVYFSVIKHILKHEFAFLKLQIDVIIKTKYENGGEL